MPKPLVRDGHIELSDNPSVPMPPRFSAPDTGSTCPGTWDSDSYESDD